MPKKSTSNSNGPLLLIGTGVVLIIVVILGQAIAGSVSNNPGTSQTNGVPRSSLAESRKAFDDKTAIFLDVRDLEYYADEHIKGAVNIPLNDLSSRYSQLDPNRWIITYCT